MTMFILLVNQPLQNCIKVLKSDDLELVCDIVYRNTIIIGSLFSYVHLLVEADFQVIS